VTVTVDKIIEIPVERIVEIPIRNEKHVENVFAVSAERPVFNPMALDIPVPVFIDKPVQANSVVEVPTERVVERRIDVPFGKVVERPVVKDLTVEVQRIVEKSQNVDRNVDIPVQVDKFVEVFKDEVIEKTITLQKIIERPVVVPKYVDRYVDKHVDVRIEVPIPKIVEIPRVNNVDKVVDANVRVQKARYSQRTQTVPINTFIRGEVLSKAQKNRFHESSQLLANTIVENEKVKAELTYLRERINIKGNMQNGLGANVNPAEVERLRRVIADLESTLRNKETERNRLRSTTSTTGEIDVQTRTDGQDIPKLQDHVRRVKAENENLKRIANKGKFESTRNFIGQRVSSALGGTATGIQQFANAFRNTAPVSTSPGFTQQTNSGNPPQRLSGGFTNQAATNPTQNYAAGANTYNPSGMGNLIGNFANTRPSNGGYTTTSPATNNYGTQGFANLAGAFADSKPSANYTTTAPATTSYGAQGAAGNFANTRPSNGGYSTTSPATNNYGTQGFANLAGAFADSKPSANYTTTAPATTSYGAQGAAGNYANNRPSDGFSSTSPATNYGTQGFANNIGNLAATRPSGGYTSTTGVPIANTYSNTGAPVISSPQGYTSTTNNGALLPTRYSDNYGNTQTGQW
jgi:hypothetical protein